jgi:ABC-type uncharacterized transport system permease subunit
MRYKIIGIVLLAAASVLAIRGLMLATSTVEYGTDSIRAGQAYLLAAIFLALVVRLLQAEKHHRTPERPVIEAPPPL